VKCRNLSLAIYNNEFTLPPADRRLMIVGRGLSPDTWLWNHWTLPT